jgi:two-component system OmpR family sensor kinase
VASTVYGRWLGPVLAGSGGLLTAVAAIETWVRVVGSYAVTVPFVAGLVTCLPFALLLVGGGYRLGRGDLSVERYPRIAGWTVAGAAFFGGFFLLVAWFFFEELWNVVGVVRWGALVGVGGGFLIGLTNARSIDRAVTAERAEVRAEEAEERRELLEYLNALLRHEVLNSVTAIDGHASILESAVDNGSDLQDRVGVIRRQTNGLTRVIEDVRFLLDVTDGKRELEPVDLGFILRDEVERLRDRHAAAEVDLDLSDETTVRADDLVRRLFANLLENAVEHNDSEPPRVSVTARCDGDSLTVDVADNGPGLPEDVRENVLRPSVDLRADHGLGLAIVDRLAKRYGGRMEIAETGPDGTVITVALPRSEKQATTESTAIGERSLTD